MTNQFEVTDRMWLAAANAYDNEMRMTGKTSTVFLEPLKAAIAAAIEVSGLLEEIDRLKDKVRPLSGGTVCVSLSPAGSVPSTNINSQKDLAENPQVLIDGQMWWKCEGNTNPIGDNDTWVRYKSPTVLWGTSRAGDVDWSDEVYYMLASPPISKQWST